MSLERQAKPIRLNRADERIVASRPGRADAPRYAVLGNFARAEGQGRRGPVHEDRTREILRDQDGVSTTIGQPFAHEAPRLAGPFLIGSFAIPARTTRRGRTWTFPVPGQLPWTLSRALLTSARSFRLADCCPAGRGSATLRRTGDNPALAWNAELARMADWRSGS
jgi:hypothetical protein